MKEQFVYKKLTEKSLEKLALVNLILDEYRADGYDLSLRQLYYQLVARGHVENSYASYKRLGNLVKNGREIGLIDWDMIADRSRETVYASHWESPAAIVRTAAKQFRIDIWENQHSHVEVMVEKDALSGILRPVCRNLDIRLTANKGYPSSSLLYEIGKRLDNYRTNEKAVWILHLADHDPSGIDMTRDIEERLSLFARTKIVVSRLALNIDQVRELNPPENPVKESDSRHRSYVEQFGESSWELDAIEPRSLAELVTEAVLDIRDEDLWEEAVSRENSMKATLRGFVDEYVKKGNK